MFGFLRNTTFLLITCATLAVSTLSLAAKTVALSGQVATMTASAATAAVANRKAIASAVARTKAKARIRRYVAAIPLVGIAAAGAFETQDYLEWQEENPERDRGDYACEVADASASVIDEVLQSLPERVRPSSDLVLSKMPECEEPV